MDEGDEPRPLRQIKKQRSQRVSVTRDANPSHVRTHGAPGMNRTCDLRFRKPLLYPRKPLPGKVLKQWPVSNTPTARVIA